MTVPSGSPPHEAASGPAAGDSVVLCRKVLGTVPVEEDGSAHFIAPAKEEVFFQALDERGLAVQSMRSVTYLHQGERLMCQGCHEPRAPSAAGHEATAPGPPPRPSRPRPTWTAPIPSATRGWSSPCWTGTAGVPCQEHRAKAPSLAREPIQRNWFASYNSLVPKYAFSSYGEGLRTIPGHFGARASKLLEILDKGHYDVKLSPEEFHRLTLWMDCCSIFYGVYEKEGGQAQLRGEVVQPTLE